MPDAPAPPKHLSREAKAFWRAVCDEYVLESHHLAILRACCESWDAYQDAREKLKGGRVVEDRFGQLVAHPLVAVERDSRIAFARLLKQLDLDTEPPRPGPGRPSRSVGGF